MQLKNAHILVIDDDEDVLVALRLLLKSKANTVTTNKNPNAISQLMEQQDFDLIILDMNFNGLVNTGNEGIYWLNKIRSKNATVPVILITAYADIDLAIRSLKEGASDFVVKPWKNDKLIVSLEEQLKKNKKLQRSLQIEKTTINGNQIIGKSEPMDDVFIKLKKVAPTDVNILILGENGTGKDLIARAIHDNSLRKNKPFVKVDVGALTDSLFESELFGYKKGAFTDAREDRKGRFEAANGGTLFLDEIGNITLVQQAKLLTILQNRQVTPLGSNLSIPIDIRLICATNVALSNLADESKFRKDLIYRINTVDMVIPPLRDRGTDITLITHYFVQLYAEKYGKGTLHLAPAFLQKLKGHSFPGNVRELQYSLERAVIMSDGHTLTENDLTFSVIEQSNVSELTRSTNLEEVEKHTILNVIEKNNGNISKSAKELGLTRTALYRRLHKYGL